MTTLSVKDLLPEDGTKGTLVGRVWLPQANGPAVVAVRGDGVFDVTAKFPTVSALCEEDNPAKALAAVKGERIGDLEAIVANTAPDGRDSKKPWLLAPLDLQTLKAAGVTFAISMLERVIEERAKGNPASAEAIRKEVTRLIGDDLSKLKPGSDQAMHLKQVLIDQNAWSQYLEVGIGPDAEVFTKAPTLSSVGTGMDAGLHPKSTWNNPEPELVLFVSSRGKIVGGALGNDVNLRDFEGRSALLLSKAKDNNASCAIGPLLRLCRRHLHTRRRPQARHQPEREGRGRFRSRRPFLDQHDQSRSHGPRRADDRQGASISRWLRAVPRHDVRTRQGSRCAGAGVHPQARRHRHDRSTPARQAHQPHAHQRRVRALDVWNRRADEEPRATEADLAPLPFASPRTRGEPDCIEDAIRVTRTLRESIWSTYAELYPHRHCERSEAIQSPCVDSFWIASLRSQ
ncbi:fumarylacetoacetate (FAA) hydrolase family protein [Bradyrhizobium sp. i1.4.4]